MQRHIKRSVGEVKLIKNEGGVLTFRALGIGFGDKNNKDLDNEFFTKDTDFGDEFSNGKFVNYDHLPFWGSNPYGNYVIKSKPLGMAKLSEVTEEGRWYDFEVSKAEAYHEYLVLLAEKGYLGVSTQAMPGSVTVKDTGEITDWTETALALTVRPANPETLGTINDIAKTMNIPLYPKIKKSLEDHATEVALEAQKKADKEKVDKEAAKEDIPKVDVIIDTKGLVEDVKAAAIKAVMESLEGPLAAIAETVDALGKAVVKMEGITENEEFKSFISGFSVKLEQHTRALKASTYVVGKAVDLSGDSSRSNGELEKNKIDENEEEDDDQQQEGQRQTKKTFLPASFQ